jgi:hypothetical protein
MAIHRRQRIWIRLRNLSSENVSDLRRYLPNTEIGTNERRVRRKDNITVLLCLDESFDCDMFCQFIAKHKVPKRNYMLWISLATDQYSDGVLVPKYVLRVLCRLGCKLNFSFTKA